MEERLYIGVNRKAMELFVQVAAQVRNCLLKLVRRTRIKRGHILTSENFFAKRYLSSSMSSASTVDHSNNCEKRCTQFFSYMGMTKVMNC